jgi:MFS family permease
MALTLSSVVAAPLWGRVLDRYQPARVLSVSVALAALTTLPLMFVQTPMQLTVSRVAFGLAAAAMVPAIIRVLKDYAPKGMDARAISYASSFQLIAMGIAPFLAGMIGPWLGLRAYFLVVVLLTLSALVLWLRRGRSD